MYICRIYNCHNFLSGRNFFFFHICVSRKIIQQWKHSFTKEGKNKRIVKGEAGWSPGQKGQGAREAFKVELNEGNKPGIRRVKLESQDNI